MMTGNDEMALGAVAALKEAGRLASVTVGGFDGSPDAVTAVAAGELVSTVLQPVDIFAEEAVRQADHFIRTGNPRERREALGNIATQAHTIEAASSFLCTHNSLSPWGERPPAAQIRR